MGILPFLTPDEHKTFERHMQMQHEFLESRGWHKSYTVNHLGHCVFLKELTAPNGKVYSDVEAFKKGENWFPDIIKDGRLGNTYLQLRKDGYVEPIYDEQVFLMSKGYTRHPDLVEDYIKNINLTKAYFEIHGFAPRWINPEGIAVGQEQSLAKESYVYPFGNDKENLKILHPDYVFKDVEEIWGLKEPY